MLQQKLLAGAVKNAHKTRENRVQDWACWGWGVVWAYLETQNVIEKD